MRLFFVSEETFDTRDGCQVKDNSFYDRAWTGHWFDMRRFSPVGRHTRRWVLKLLRMVDKPKSIADIGCGDGLLLMHIRRQYPAASLFGSDFSGASLAICRKRLPDSLFLMHDVLAGGNPFGQIMDVGISSEVIEHVADDLAALKNMAQVCRNLIITVPGGELNDTAKQMGHLRHYDSESLCNLVIRSGLQVVYCRSWGYPFAYPLYARVRNQAGYEVVTGRYGLVRRSVTHGLYFLFFLNDIFSGGNKIFLLARNR